jgi:hypothetical protein
MNPLPKPPTTKFKRKPGAPKGNRNALRHGAYARPSPPDQTSTTTETSPPKRLSITREISLLRAYFIRYALIGASEPSLDRTGEILCKLSIGATALARLIKIEESLFQSTGLQVQPDNLQTAMQNLDLMHHMLADKSSPEPESLPEPPTSTMLSAAIALARQAGVPLNILSGSLQPDVASPKSTIPSPQDGSDQ